MLLFLFICVTCCNGSQLLSASLIGQLFWYGGAFLVVPPVTFVSSVDRHLVYLDAEPFVPLLLASYLVPRAKTATRQRRAFSIVGPSTSVVHNVRPAGQIRPATSPEVARDVQQEKRLLRVGTDIKSTADHKSSMLNQLTTIFNLTSLGSSWPLKNYKKAMLVQVI